MDRNEKDFFRAIQDMERRLRIVERNNVGGAGGGTGLETLLDVTNFNGLLTPAEVDAQKAFDKLDDSLNGAVQVFGGTLGGELTGIKTITTRTITPGLTNNGNRITISQAGKYFIHAQQLVSTGAGAAIYLHIRKNGVTQNYGYINANTSTTDAIASTAIDCVAGDYIEIYIQNSCTSVWTGTHSDISIFKITQGQKGEKGLQWKGGWDSATAYVVDDAVYFEGVAYICKQNNTNQMPPSTTYWDVLVESNAHGKIGFAAYNNQGGDQSSTGIFRANVEIFDEGGCFDTSTYKFTAPVAGIYQFNWACFANFVTGRVAFFLNGNNHIQGNTGDKTLSATMKLNAGDQVWVGATAGFTMYWYGAVGHNMFSGSLVGGQKGLDWRGAWSNATEYFVDNLVSYNGQLFICKARHTNQAPAGGTYWDVFLAGNQSLVPYMHLGMSADQVSPANGNTVNFNRVKSSSGLQMSGNGIALKAGKTYKLEAHLCIGGTGALYLGYAIYDGATMLGTADDYGYTTTPTNTNVHGMKAPAIVFYTPPVDTVVYVKITNAGGMPAGSYIEFQWGTSFIAQEVVAGAKGDKGDAGTLNIDTINGELDVNGDILLPAGKQVKANGITILGRTFVEYDTTARTFGTTFANGKTWSASTIRDGFDILVDFEFPVRNDSASWGGGYVEMFFRINGGAWVSMGVSGFQLAMCDSANVIMMYKKSIAMTRAELGAPATGDFTIEFIQNFKSYDSTLQVNTNDGTSSTRFKSQKILKEVKIA